MRLRTVIALSLLLLFASIGIYFSVVTYQRELILVALSNVQFYDGVDPRRVIFELPAGESRIIERCDDKKSVIEPVIMTDDGKPAHKISGGIRIESRPTGLLSMPQYLGCPGY